MNENESYLKSYIISIYQQQYLFRSREPSPFLMPPLPGMPTVDYRPSQFNIEDYQGINKLTKRNTKIF